MGELIDSFKKAARKATLSTLLATTLVTGVGVNSAFAQQAGPPPQPSGGVATAVINGQNVQVTPWANDPNYVALMQAYDHQVAARERVYNVTKESQHRIGNATWQIQEANLETQRGAYMARGAAGWAQYGAVQAQINGAHEAQSIQVDAQFDNAQAREDALRAQYQMQLDTRFGNLPQYKDGGAGVNQGRPWFNDPAYRNAMSTVDKQQAAVYHLDQVNETAQLRVLDANQASQQISVNTAQGPLVIRQGLPGMARLGAYDDIMSANYKLQRVSTEANYELKHAQMESQRAEYQFNLDYQFSIKPQYKNAAPTTAPVQRTAPGVRTPGS